MYSPSGKYLFDNPGDTEAFIFANPGDAKEVSPGGNLWQSGKSFWDYTEDMAITTLPVQNMEEPQQQCTLTRESILYGLWRMFKRSI